MPEILHAAPEDLDTREKRGTFTVSVTGCNKEGVFYSIAFAEAGFRVIITDKDQNTIRRLAKGKLSFINGELDSKLKNLVKTGRIKGTSDLKSAVMQSDIIVVTNVAKIDTKKKIDYKEVENDCKQIGTALRKGTVVIFGNILGLGFIEGLARENIENASGLKVGTDFGLAYSPSSQHGVYSAGSMDNLELQVAALEPASLKAASIVLGTIAKKGTTEVANIKTLELSVLFGAIQRDTNVALSNELAILCETLEQNYFEILKLMERINPKIRAVPTVFGESDKVSAYLLFEAAENLNIKMHVSLAARHTNEEMTKHAVNLIQEALRDCGKTLRRARIALLGFPVPRSAAYSLFRALETKGARINIYDPALSENIRAEIAASFKKTLNEAVEGTDCIIILSDQDQINRLNFRKIHAEMKPPAALIDLVGIIEQDKVEKEGYIFRSIGKGIGKR
jgi:UDP-N-acetyl-D-mannosaminuronic acid dehydrogenase